MNELDNVVQEFKTAMAFNKAFYGKVQSTLDTRLTEKEIERKWEFERTHLSKEKKEKLYRYVQERK